MMQELFESKIRLAGLMGAMGLVGGVVLVAIVRSLQGLEPFGDLALVAVIAVLSGLGGLTTGAGIVTPSKIFAGDPGVSRALTMGALGFLLGALLVILIRGLQGLEPLWDTGLGIVTAAFTTSGFFLWGMGAFDPAMSVHGEHAHEEEEETEEEADEESVTILGTYVWQISAGLIILLILVAVFAVLPGGPGIITTNDPVGEVGAIGQVEIQLPFGGPLVYTSQLVVFIGFVIFTMLSIAAAAGVIGLLMYVLSYNTNQVRANEPTEDDLRPPLPVQVLGRLTRWIAGVLRALPRFLGQK